VQYKYLWVQDFYFHYKLKTNYPGHNIIWGAQKILGGTAPSWPPSVAMGLPQQLSSIFW